MIKAGTKRESATIAIKDEELELVEGLEDTDAVAEDAATGAAPERVGSICKSLSARWAERCASLAALKAPL